MEKPALITRHLLWGVALVAFAILGSCSPVTTDATEPRDEIGDQREADDGDDSAEFDDDIDDRSHRYRYARKIYPGRTVRVPMVIDVVVTPRVFQSSERLNGQPETLVIHDSALDLDENEFVRVVGKVIRIGSPGTSKEIGDAVPDHVLDDFQGELAIVADHVEASGA